MAVVKDHKLLVKRLKRKLLALQKKEEKSRHRLKVALKKTRQLSKSYHSKLANHIRVMRIKMGVMKASTYAKIANDIQKHLLEGIALKEKLLRTALHQLEKKHGVKLIKPKLQQKKQLPKTKVKAKKRAK